VNATNSFTVAINYDSILLEMLLQFSKITRKQAFRL